jgi:hypothetical protein
VSEHHRRRALVHVAKGSFYAAALLDQMLTDDVVPDVEAVNDLLLRLDDLDGEVESARAELRAIHPRELP